MRQNLSCSVAQDLLPQFVEKLLSPESEAELKTHLESCPKCREVYKAMTSPEPDLSESAAEVDYLKKIRKNRRRILAFGLAALLLITCGFLIYLKVQQRRADAELAEQEQITTDLMEQIAQNAVSYDTASKTMVIYGNQVSDKTVLPPEIEEAVYLDAQFDSFHLSVYLPYLRTGEQSMETYLPLYLERTDNSFSFIRSYLMENCPDQYPAQRASKYVELTIHQKESYSWSESENRIQLELGSYYWHREEVYILALLGSEEVRWKQLGYCWYLSSCIDPYSDLFTDLQFESPDKFPYAAYYAQLGGTEELTPDNYRKLNDAVSCVCLTRGMNWGTPYESFQLKKTAMYKGPNFSNDPGDNMSVSMAASMIAWLSDRYGFDRVSSFCFDQLTFEEAFGTDFRSAYAEWSAWILECCGAQ